MAEQERSDLEEILVDQNEDETPIEIAPDRRRVKTNKKDLPVDTLHSWVARGKVNPQPDFQRYFVWNNLKASRLIESLLLDIPIPVVYVAEEANKTYSVVDGQQRITSIHSYIGGKFPGGQDFTLSGLQVLKEINGRLFRQLSIEQQEAIMNSTITLIVIEQDSDPRLTMPKLITLGTTGAEAKRSPGMRDWRIDIAIDLGVAEIRTVGKIRCRECPRRTREFGAPAGWT